MNQIQMFYFYFYTCIYYKATAMRLIVFSDCFIALSDYNLCNNKEKKYSIVGTYFVAGIYLLPSNEERTPSICR